MEFVTSATQQNLMFLTAFIGLAGGLKAYLAAYEVRETMAISSIVITQRKRYIMLAAGQLILAGIPAYCLLVFGPDSVWRGIQEYWSIPLIGWIVAGVNALALVSPLLTAIVGIHVYRKPAMLARKAWKKRGFLFTHDVRSGVANPRRAWIYKWIDDSGFVRKEYRYDN